MSNTDEWVLHARRFVALGKKEHLDRARQTCRDPRLLDYLKRTDVEAGYVMNTVFQPLYNALDAQGRNAEAAMVQILALRSPAMVADQPDAMTAESADFAKKVCDHLAALSHMNGFAECKALFVRTLGVIADERGDFRESMELLAEALGIYTDLAWQDEVTFAPFVAAVLTNIAVTLTSLKQVDKALDAEQEALSIYRKLERDFPGTYLRQITLVMTNLGASLRSLGQKKEARARYEEAIRILEGMRKQRDVSDPAQLSVQLALAKSNLSNLLSELNELHAARELGEQAATILRETAAKHPACHKDLVRTLNNLGAVLQKMGLFTEAEAILNEATR